MKPHASIVVAVIVTAWAMAIGIQRTCAQPKDVKAQTPSKWEYKRAESLSDTALSKLGEDGWELVTALGGQAYIASSATSVGLTPRNTSTTNTIEYGKVIYVFRRSKQ